MKFKECQLCVENPYTSILCESCQNNRQLIAELQDIVSRNQSKWADLKLKADKNDLEKKLVLALRSEQLYQVKINEMKISSLELERKCIEGIRIAFSEMDD